MTDRDTSATTQCPYCMEEISEEAVICPHCRSRLRANSPTHGGTCPYCKEAINPEATKCKYCGSFVGPSSRGSGAGMKPAGGMGPTEVTAPVMVTPASTGYTPAPSMPASMRSAAAATGGRGPGGIGLGDLPIWCTGHWSCYPCTRCIPFTDICWESTCCDLVGIDCGF
jgi:hypothetical protein